MSTASFQKIHVGTILEIPDLAKRPAPLKKGYVTIHYPARLEAMALDPSKVAEREDQIYRAGQIDFVISIFKHVTVRIIEGEGEIIISESTPRPALVRHAALIMKKTLGFNQSLSIHMSEDISLRHCGLGSSSGSIAAVASAINELFSRPLNANELSKLCAQNHGEEIDGDDNNIIPVQCLGGSVIGGNFQGSLIIVAGRATPIVMNDLPEDMCVVIGVPNDYTHPDSDILMKQESDHMKGFINSGEVYAKDIAYKLVHEVIPDLTNGDLRACKELIYQYRWNMGSIKNCSFALPRIVDIAEALRHYQHDEEISIFSLSSVGPGFFALTSNPGKVVRDFKNLNMKTIITTIHNGTYKVGE